MKKFIEKRRRLVWNRRIGAFFGVVSLFSLLYLKDLASFMVCVMLSVGLFLADHNVVWIGGE